MKAGGVITFVNSFDHDRDVRSPSGNEQSISKKGGSKTFTAEAGTYQLRSGNGTVLDTLTVTVVP
jgi:hypothetical protein